MLCKRTKRIIPQEIAQEDNTIQHFYNVGDLLETICQLPPFDDVLANLARNTSKRKEKILMNMRGLFSRSEGLIAIERGDYVCYKWAWKASFKVPGISVTATK